MIPDIGHREVQSVVAYLGNDPDHDTMIISSRSHLLYLSHVRNTVKDAKYMSFFFW